VGALQGGVGRSCVHDTFRYLSGPPGSEGALHTIEAGGLNDHDLAVGYSAYLLQPGVTVAQRIPIPT
jgi:hypothetical protein